MKFACYTDWNQLPESADALFARGERDSIFFSRPWFENLTATALDDGQCMTLACVVAENKVRAILPLMKPAGDTWSSLSHRYTPIYSLLLADEGQPQILACLAQGLSRMPLRGLLFGPVADDDTSMHGLQRALETAGFSCDRRFRLYNWRLRVQGRSFSDYMAARPARLRNTISRKQRKLEREHGCEIRLFSGNEVPRAMSGYNEVYNASWKANEQYGDFLDGIVSAYSRPGWSRLGILYVDEKPIAAQLWFVRHRKASIFRLAYDEAWRGYSPGSILTAFMMEYVIDCDGVDEVDFLSGNDAYKQDWMSERRERVTVSCVKRAERKSWYERLIASLKGDQRRQSN